MSWLERVDSPHATIVAFPPSWLGAWAQPIGRGHVLPARASEALAAPGVVAALDGAMFSRCDSGGSPAEAAGLSEAQRYALSRCAAPRFGLYDARAGLNIAPTSPGEGLTISVDAAGVAHANDGATIPDGAVFAAQLYPPLVSSGHNVASNVGSNATAEWRAGLAILDDGRCAFAVGALDMVGFAEALRLAGAVSCGYSDGGGSARLALADGAVYGAAEDRPVAAWFVARPPSGTDLATAVVTLGLGGVAATGLWRLLTGSWPWDEG